MICIIGGRSVNKKICFIIRGENDFLCQEVLHYISYLTVPEGYEIEYTIKQGKVGQAYDAGMKETDAIIKVYLDENIFLGDKLSRTIDTVSKDVKDIHTTTDKITKRFNSINSVEMESITHEEG